MKRITGVIGIFAVPISFALSQISAGAATTVTPTGQDVNTAVEKGVAYLDTQQNLNGSYGINSGIAIPETSLALIAYGVSDRGDVNNLSADRKAKVKKAVQWLLDQQDKSTDVQKKGAWQSSNLYTYSTGLALSALSFSKNANAGTADAITAGRAALIRLFQGPPNQVCTTVDTDPTSNNCGGFNYDFPSVNDFRSDESNTGFGLTGLQLTGGVPPAFAAIDVGWQRHVQELSTNKKATRNDGGGTYQPNCEAQWPASFCSNANDTGSLLFGYGYDGVAKSDAGVAAALKFGQDVLDVYELDKAKGTDAARTMVYHTGANEDGSCSPGLQACDWHYASGEGGYHYSLWALSKGLGEYISPDLTSATNWYHKIADLLVSQQGENGSWPADLRDDASVVAATGFAIFALGLAATPPPPVTNFSAAPFAVNGQCTGVHLSWTNPNSPNYGGVEIRRRTDQSPSSHSDGTLVTKANRPATKFDDKGLTANKTYFYGAFSYDTTGQLFGPEATATASTATCVLAPTGQPRSSPNYLGPGLLLFVLGLAVAFGRERRLRLG
ncbi:MAG: hypothetical protein E6H92_04485 [Chloroflexi bacterium]|nr:MAG: hypothetical protein E6H92_04485 [Chloroflexota bacterium]